jgi:hypothetical protein
MRSAWDRIRAKRSPCRAGCSLACSLICRNRQVKRSRAATRRPKERTRQAEAVFDGVDSYAARRSADSVCAGASAVDSIRAKNARSLYHRHDDHHRDRRLVRRDEPRARRGSTCGSDAYPTDGYGWSGRNAIEYTAKYATEQRPRNRAAAAAETDHDGRSGGCGAGPNADTVA